VVPKEAPVNSNLGSVASDIGSNLVGLTGIGDAILARLHANQLRHGGIADHAILGSHRVAVVKSTESRHRDDPALANGSRRHSSASGRVLPGSS
jgi:hypothetical protein